MSTPPQFNLPPVDPTSAAAAPAAITPELLAGLLADGDDELSAWALRQEVEAVGRAATYDGLLREAMALVGERWQSGRWTIAEEHLASRTLLRTLERLRPEPGPEGRIGPLAVLAGVSGEEHMIGLVCLEQALVEDGWTVANLGADMPAHDLGRFVAQNAVSLVCLSASDPNLAPVLQETVRALRLAAVTRPIPVIVGGGISAHGAAATVGADVVARSLVEARNAARARRAA